MDEQDKLLLTTIYHSKAFAVAVMVVIAAVFVGSIYFLLKKVDAKQPSPEILPSLSVAEPSPQVQGARTYLGPNAADFERPVPSPKSLSLSPPQSHDPSSSPTSLPTSTPIHKPTTTPVPSLSPSTTNSPEPTANPSPSPSETPVPPSPSPSPSPSQTSPTPTP